MNQKENINTSAQPCYHKTIGKTIYAVKIYFSESAKESLAEKIKRMLREEAGKL